MALMPLLLALAATHAAPDGTRLQPDRACYTMTATRDGKTAEFGHTWQTIERTRHGKRDAWRVVVHQLGGNGRFDMRDIFLLDAATLAPIQFRNERNGQEHVRLAYLGDRVTGQRIGDDGKAEAIDVPLAEPVWEGNLFGVLFAALPLAEGGHYRVPYYQYDKGLGEFTVNVKGTERVATPAGPVEAWVLDAGADDKQRMEYLIARSPQRELGYRGGGFAQALGGDCADLAARDAGADAAPAE